MAIILLENARLLPMEGGTVTCGFVLAQNGVITAWGSIEDMPTAQAGWQVIDAEGCWVMPGLVDVHSHLGLYEEGLGLEGADGNEDTDPAMPHLRVIDGINPMDRAFREALASGVTTVVVSPGSANPIGGQLAACKTMGRRIDDMILAEPVGIKFAFGENPKMAYHEKEETPVTRMATAAIIRENLRRAQEYGDRKRKALENEDEDLPDFDPKCEALLPLLSGKIPAHIHAHRADDMFTALRVCKEFSIRPILIHGTEAHLVADLLAGEGVPVVSGPYMTDRSKPELINMTEAAPGLLHRAGIPLAITTDHPEVPAKYLRLAAGVAVQAGLDEDEAMRAITINGARIAGIDDRVGSIAVGKDADLLVLNGHPLDYRTRVEMVICAGKTAYRRKMHEGN